MAKLNPPDNQSGQYDKIIKENLEKTLPVIIREVLHLNIAEQEELPDDIQHTKERKPDALKKVTDTAGNTYVLHIEFQIADEKEMVYRMAEYYIMLKRKYQIPIKQYVIFLKDITPSMATTINDETMLYRYTLIRIATADYKLFLKAEHPEVKMLGILGSFDKEDTYEAIKAVVNEVQAFAKSDFAESRYFKQLRIFVKLRGNIEQQFLEVMESVEKYFKEEEDVFYIKGAKKGRAVGREEGREEERIEFITKIIVSMGLSDDQISNTFNIPIDFVKSVRNRINK